MNGGRKMTINRVLLIIDHRIFKNSIRKLLNLAVYTFNLKKLKSDVSIVNIQGFLSDSPSLLSELCDQYGSDKGSSTLGLKPYPWPPHDYTAIYSLIFSLSRHSVRNVLECGIGTNDQHIKSNMTNSGKPGASLRVWRDFFPLAEIYGVDIDPKALFHENRINTFEVDQTSKSSIERFKAQIPNIEFDIIIDDGLHEFFAGQKFFINTFGILRNGGFYVIEDIIPSDIKKYRHYFSKMNIPFSIYFFNNLSAKRSLDNVIIVIQKSNFNENFLDKD
jgi:SAM-dependent methyltransferase